MHEMIGRQATYFDTDVTITGYVRWGEPLKVKKVWFTHNSTGEAHSKGLVDIKDVTIQKTHTKRKSAKIH